MFMKYSRIFVHLFFSVMILAGCATQPYLDRAVIRNETGGVISDVRVRNEPTGAIGQVHSILPNSAFEIGFSASPMMAKKSIITWENQNGQRYSAELQLPREHQGKGKGKSSVLVYTIYPEDKVTVALED